MIRLGAFNGPNLADDPRVREARRQLYDYLRRPPEERAERRVFIEESLFFEGDVRDAVFNRCHGKCVFCEQPPSGREVVDHFRPIRDARALNGKVERDFYAWLAYEFDNLVVICRECARGKGTMFPVFGERAPYIASLNEIRRLEKPILLDPYRDQVDRHFDFLSDGWCEPLDVRGQVTVKILDLNRDRLIHLRKLSISKFFEELQEAVGQSERSLRIHDLFLPDREFAGARLSILRRILRGVTFSGRSLSGPIGAQLLRFEELCERGLSDNDRDRLLQRIKQLPIEDHARERSDGELGIQDGVPKTDAISPWAAVRRNGPLTFVAINHFKGLESLELHLQARRRSRSAPCLMLLGENGAGKSSILQAIALTLLGGREARRLRLDAMDFLASRTADRWDQLAPDDAEVTLGFLFDQQVTFRLDSELRQIAGNQPVSAIVLGYGPRRYFDPNNSRRTGGAYARVTTLFRPTATIPFPGTWLNQLQPHEWTEVAQIIRIVLTLSDDDELVRDLDGRICLNLAGRLVPLEWLSEGYRSVFAMVADIARELLPRFPILEEAEAIVLIDEIETHLHPRWKMRIMSALRRALPNVQFIVATHDPLCLRGMDDGEVVVLQRTADGSIVALENLPSIKGMRADQLLTSDYFGLSSTIDPQTELDMARYVDAVADLPPDRMAEAERLVRHLTIGDDAQEQIIHRAMRQFIEDRERPTKTLRSDISENAVNAILLALKDDTYR